MKEDDQSRPNQSVFQRLCHWKLMLMREHQFPAFLMTLLGLAGIGIYFCWQGIMCGRLADIDDAPKAKAEYRVDLNSADWPELVVLPGIGEKLARAIVEHRTRFGQFKDHREIMDIHGIGEIKLDQLRPYLLPISN